jgi:transposase
LLTISHKALTIRGIKPVCRYEHQSENTWLFGTFSPVNGSHFLLELPYCNSDMFQLFLNEFSKHDEQEFKIMILDNGAFHHAKRLKIPSNIALVFLPPYSPELNPAEKVWWMIKRELKMKHFQSLRHLQDELALSVKKICTHHAIQLLTAYSYYQNII